MQQGRVSRDEVPVGGSQSRNQSRSQGCLMANVAADHEDAWTDDRARGATRSSRAPTSRSGADSPGGGPDGPRIRFQTKRQRIGVAWFTCCSAAALVLTVRAPA